MAHTTGPWQVNYDPEHETRPLEVALVSNPDHRIAFTASNGNPDDALLLAAAPDVLEALIGLEDWITNGDTSGSQAGNRHGRKVVIAARAAIAKARPSRTGQT